MKIIRIKNSDWINELKRDNKLIDMCLECCHDKYDEHISMCLNQLVFECQLNKTCFIVAKEHYENN